jgi:hypothetical protein
MNSPKWAKLEPIRVRIMQEAYDCADRDEPEAYNSIKVMCGEVLILVEELIKAEREACAKLCEDSVPTYLKDGERWLKGQNGRPDVRLKEIAPNLEAAWEAEQLLKNGSVIESYSVQHQCAAAIRARGNQ